MPSPTLRVESNRIKPIAKDLLYPSQYDARFDKWQTIYLANGYRTDSEDRVRRAHYVLSSKLWQNTKEELAAWDAAEGPENSAAKIESYLRKRLGNDKLTLVQISGTFTIEGTVHEYGYIPGKNGHS